MSGSDIGIVPPADFAVVGNKRLILEIDNDEMLVIGRYNQIKSSAVQTNNTLLIYDKKKGMWSNRTIGTDGAAIRGFGSWIATAHAELKRAVVNGVLQPNPGAERESPGGVFRRNVVNPNSRERERVSIDTLFQSPRSIFRAN